MYKKILSLLILSLLILPSYTYAFTQGYTVSNFGTTGANQTYCRQDLNYYIGNSNINYLLFYFDIGQGHFELMSGDEMNSYYFQNGSYLEITNMLGWVTGSGENPIGNIISVDCDNLGGGGGGGGGGTLLPNDTIGNVFGSIAGVTSGLFGSYLPYLLLIIGIPLTFYIIEQLLKTAPKEKKKKNYIDVTNDGYHRIYGKKGQYIGWAKN